LLAAFLFAVAFFGGFFFHLRFLLNRQEAAARKGGGLERGNSNKPRALLPA
jgi:hypothetical protein